MTGPLGVAARLAGALVWSVGALLAPASGARAQTPAPARPPQPCRGEVVSSIVVQTVRPTELQRLDSLSHRLRLARFVVHHSTDPAVVLRYLLVQAGDRCDEFHRAESERVLRAQPFLSDARIRVVPVVRDTINLVVTTEDELTLIIGLRIRAQQLDRFRFGSSNLDGQGVSISASYRNGYGFRYGVGIRATDYQAFGRPWVADLEAVRNPLGGTWSASLSEPLYTALHQHTWYAGVSRRHSYQGYQRESGDPVSLDLDRMQWLAGAAWRIGPPTHAVFAGPLAAGEQTSGGTTPVIVTRDELLPYNGGGISGGDYENTRVRWGGLLGYRRVQFVTSPGFDALTAPQDLESGVEAVVLGARSTVERDFLGAASLYAGRATPRSLLGLQVEGEARRPTGGPWQGVLMSARAAWYFAPAPRRLHSLSAEFSGGWDTRLPIQVTLSERDAGMRGFDESTVGGARRLVVRAEERWVAPPRSERFDIGAAAFADVGRLWAGDAPFGVTTPVQASVGVSLVAAIPSGSKRVWRLDFAVPITHAGAPARMEVRARVRDFTQFFWREPVDVTLARDGALLSRVLGHR